MGRGRECQAPRQICTGGKERKGRPPQQKRSGPSDGVDSSSRCLPEPVETVGQAPSRPLRHLKEHKTRPVLLSNIRSKGNRSGCPSAGLEGSGHVCFSSLQDPGRDSKEVHRVRFGKNDSDRSVLACPRLVHRGTGMVGGPSKIPSTKEGFTQTTPLRQVSQKPPRSQSDWLQTVQSLVRVKGFSSKAAKAIARARRSSTLRVYQLKWDVFCCWCRNKKVSSSSTSVTQIADFILFLREECGLAVSTIKGYRSMLAAVFRHRGLNISENKDLHDLIRSFETTKKGSLRTPSWNLDVVLQFFSSSRFEPPHSASFRDLTKKSLFLMALASAKRMSELQAIEGKVGFKDQSVVCSFLPSFFTKNENPSNPWPRSFEVQSLSALVGEESERALCPVRSLQYYLRRKEQLKGNTDVLWCSVRDPSRPLSKNVVAFFLRSLVKEAHVDCDEDQFKLLKVMAHEVRAIATSLAFSKNMSVQNLMKATFWRCHSVFASHYLRDIRITYDKCFALGPYVSADLVLGQVAEMYPC
ncbi:uncharacterized protein LOC135202200 [Macrobrachium nipponense]|uniref:uncharacterized protein LOC135202200 n=1 Tax=Macrobrachium nipponense TaxID=159736 RepID=UPI0030C89A85